MQSENYIFNLISIFDAYPFFITFLYFCILYLYVYIMFKSLFFYTDIHLLIYRYVCIYTKINGSTM